MTYLDETTPEELKLAKRRSLLPLGLADWWPIAVGLALGFLSPLIYPRVEDLGKLVLWAIYPFVVLSGSPQLSLSALTSLQLPQLLTYAQFPMEGIVAWYAMRRGVGFLGTLFFIFVIHLVGFSALVLMTYTSELTR